VDQVVVEQVLQVDLEQELQDQLTLVVVVEVVAEQVVVHGVMVVQVVQE
tara:strand:- start:134 stop:280 length:147 start_codon:yes stop_codon:yes gene_type:complete